MRHLIFQAPAHHTLTVDDQTVRGGEPFEVEDEERALELLTQPGLTVAEATPEPDAPETLSRTALDALAREQGIEEPERLPNKAAVIAALNQPEASGGEGQHTTEMEA